MVEVKQSRSVRETLERRQRNSGGGEGCETIESGSGPRRLFHNVHRSGGQAQHGEVHRGEGSIDNQPRGPADQGANR
jgi:hypothetical protein